MVSLTAAGAVHRSPGSRRAFVGAAAVAAAAGSATLLAACSTRRHKSAPTETPGLKPSALRADVRLLNSVLDLEHRAIAAYTASIPLLPGRTRTAAQRFLIQELAHAEELSALVHKGGGKPNPPSPSYDLGNPASTADVLTLLHAIERDQIAAYLDLLPQLTPGTVRSTAASMLANEAEHISVLRTQLGNTAVPSAFVTAAE